MTAKRALVVDDSRSARISLQKLLEKYHIAVDFAESGEEALDYLKHHMVDAIFMDHTMPGMDGLETVVAIKSNPRTATIPVMMYTAKEGEVYVSQARALGAIGVLPKQVQPGVLFEMLGRLGLVQPEGAAHLPSASEPHEPPASDSAHDVHAHAPGAEPPPARQSERPLERFADSGSDAEYDQQALGASVQALITKVLNEQHVKLRSDILTTHRDFARQVAAEIFAKERAALPPTPVEADPPAGLFGRNGRTAAAALLLLIPLVVVAVLYGQARAEREGLQGEVERLGAMVRQRESAIDSLSKTRTSDRDAEREIADTRYVKLVRTVEWALNQDRSVEFDEPAFDDHHAAQLEGLLGDLVAAGFRGRVRLESHLGEFCLAADPAGSYRLAPPGTPIDACSRLGHPLDDSSIPEERQTTAFASFLASSPLVTGSGIEVELIAHDRQTSVPEQPIPSSITTAGEWNEAARRNNRVQFTIVPADA